MTGKGVGTGLRFIPIGPVDLGPGKPVACTARYPFHDHMTCAEWAFEAEAA